jgi:hypothetical protein
MHHYNKIYHLDRGFIIGSRIYHWIENGGSRIDVDNSF